jgi:hypothetical protein
LFDLNCGLQQRDAVHFGRYTQRLEKHTVLICQTGRWIRTQEEPSKLWQISLSFNLHGVTTQKTISLPSRHSSSTYYCHMTLTLKCTVSCYLHLNVQVSCLVELRGVWRSRDVAPLILDSCSKCRLALSPEKQPPVPCDKRGSVVCPALSHSHLHINLLAPEFYI